MEFVDDTCRTLFGTDLLSEEERMECRRLYAALGAPVTVPFPSDPEGGMDYDRLILYLSHPVFGLLEHRLGMDSYKACGYRGDQLAIPVYDEEGHVHQLCIAFHKGNMYMEFLSWPNADPDDERRLYDLLVRCETR